MHNDEKVTWHGFYVTSSAKAWGMSETKEGLDGSLIWFPKSQCSIDPTGHLQRGASVKVTLPAWLADKNNLSVEAGVPEEEEDVVDRMGRYDDDRGGY